MRIDGVLLCIQVTPLDPDVRLRTELNVVILELVALVLSTDLVLGVLLVPLVHAHLCLPLWYHTGTFLERLILAYIL